MAETPIVSDTLQKTFRDNFPSQISSGRDLHVSDTIIPIVDFSSTAGTTGLSNGLQEALAFSNANVVSVGVSSTLTILNLTGFWRVTLQIAISGNNGGTESIVLNFNDGSTDKAMYTYSYVGAGFDSDKGHFIDLDKIFFLRAGDSLNITTSSRSTANGSCRQVADISGTLVNPTGYTGS